ncbi:MAG: DUF5011 domain-containing protein [Candidatus Nomurabacteria bacterium]|nr:DUF5011 domain-containing protein [Candidatus Nomurabacteria bacterium]
MKNLKLFVLVLLLLSYSNVLASDVCSKSGFTIATVNGIFTDNIGAKENKENLKKLLPSYYKNEKVTVDYIYNSTHIGGAGDIIDAIAQGLFNSKTDFDLVDMLNDASNQVRTQKILLVGHSQGNFYVNNFYDKIAGKDGGVPVESIGVYSVATPSDRVAGDGKYLTSDTDSVIATLVGSVKNIMTPNTHIDLTGIKSNGHDFSQVYLKYRGDQIVLDIQSSLENLAINQTQDGNNKCISPQKINIFHKASLVVIGAADFVVNSIIKIGSFSFNAVKGGVKSLVNIFGNNANNNLAAAGSYDNKNIFNDTEQTIKNGDILAETLDPNIINEKVSSDVSVVDTNDISVVDDSSVNNEEPISTVKNPVVSSGAVNNSSSGWVSGGGGGSSSSNDTAIKADILAPVITVLGESIVTVSIGSIYVDAGATALDDKDGVISVVSTGFVDTSSAGVYIITYTASDSTNNISTSIRTINVVPVVIVDIISPVITLVGENTVTVFKGSVYVDAGATALDNKDGVISVLKTGVVDTSIVGTYLLTYTATDAANNVSNVTRTVNVVEVIPRTPVVSTTATLSIPNSGNNALDGLDTNRGRKNLTPFIFQVIYTDLNNNSPQDVKLHVKDKTTGIYLADSVMSKISQGFGILSDGDFSNGELFTVNNTYDQGDYIYSFSADDKTGDFAKIENDNLFRFSVIPSTYTYIPKSSFGINNGDNNDWQVWSFNGSNVYDWTDTYVNNYLREQFKVQSQRGYYCSQCLQRGVFSHDPQKGFETTDVSVSSLEYNLQNMMNGKTYDVAIQWDTTGYVYTITDDLGVVITGHTDVLNINNNMWVGWDGSFNNFTTFPSGLWENVPYLSPMGRTGGSSMVLQPFPIYDSIAVQTPTPTPTPTPVLSSLKSITSFDFNSITPSVIGIVDNNMHTVKLTVPYGAAISALVPTILTADKSSVLPTSLTAQDFTNPVTYIVKAEDGSTLSYIATVTISPNPIPTPDPVVPDSTLPVISSYTLNGSQGSININPLINSLDIVLNSNKNVNWMSLKIEKENDVTLYRMFQSNSTTCVDGTNVCSKNWDGILSSGGLLQSGNYRIKVHIKDVANNEYDDYLPVLIIVNTQ